MWKKYTLAFNRINFLCRHYMYIVYVYVDLLCLDSNLYVDIYDTIYVTPRPRCRGDHHLDQEVVQVTDMRDACIGHCRRHHVEQL